MGNDFITVFWCAAPRAGQGRAGQGRAAGGVGCLCMETGWWQAGTPRGRGGCGEVVAIYRGQGLWVGHGAWGIGTGQGPGDGHGARAWGLDMGMGVE